MADIHNPKARWIPIRTSGTIRRFVCSHCGHTAGSLVGEVPWKCHDCGAEMIGEPHGPPADSGWRNPVFAEFAKGLSEGVKSTHKSIEEYNQKMEESEMKVSYKDYTGRLMKLERKSPNLFPVDRFELAIQLEEGEIVTFPDVLLKDVSFTGGRISLAE